MPMRKGQKRQRRRVVKAPAKERAWQSMRILRSFDITQIIATAEVSEDNARRFILALVRTGYLRVARPHVSGRTGSRIVYRLVRDTGPLPPILWTDGRVFDPNRNEIFEPLDGDRSRGGTP